MLQIFRAYGALEENGLPKSSTSAVTSLVPEVVRVAAPEIPVIVAVIVELPGARASARPALLTSALVALELQTTEAVRFLVVPPL